MIPHDLEFRGAEVADADLHQSRRGNFVEHILHDAGMRPAKAFVGRAQIAVGVEMQDAQGRGAQMVGAGRDSPKRHRVIAADDDWQLSELEERADLCLHPVVDALASGVDEGDVLGGGDVACNLGADGRQSSGASQHVELIKPSRHRHHGDPALPGLTDVAVEEVDLVTGQQDRPWTARRALAVTDGGLERHGDNNHMGLVHGVWEAVKPSVLAGRSVWVKFHAAPCY